MSLLTLALLALLGQEVGVSVGVTRLKIDATGSGVVVAAPAFQLEDGSGVLLLEDGSRLLLE